MVRVNLRVANVGGLLGFVSIEQHLEIRLISEGGQNSNRSPDEAEDFVLLDTEDASEFETDIHLRRARTGKVIKKAI